jgi:L-threonylcarbamoyladenylate synthase
MFIAGIRNPHNLSRGECIVQGLKFHRLVIRKFVKNSLFVDWYRFVISRSMDEEIKNALEVLRKGGTILYPTDTVWGIGCDARSKDAVAKVFKIKQRAEYKSMVTLVCDHTMLNRYVKEVPEVAWDLIEAADSPLTIIYPDARLLAGNVIAADGSVGIRLVNDEFCRDLIHKFGKPIVSTSANISGEAAPSSFNDIKIDILNKVDYIVNLRQKETNNIQPSTIIKVALNGEFKIIRK